MIIKLNGNYHEYSYHSVSSYTITSAYVTIKGSRPVFNTSNTEVFLKPV